MLDFSKEIIKIFCILPCEGKRAGSHIRALSIYKGDRLSVLQQSRSTGETNIWVTEKKIVNGDDGGNVVWIKFMTVSRPNFPMLVRHISTSYFVDNNIYGKSLVLCCRSKKPKEAWVYIVRGDLCKKIKIDEVVCDFQSSVYVPSLINIF
ncbi:PREDICTED: putative F-box protein At1g58090 [Camelina sativa]|uniref:F-box protein At1g58090 n=1 Tax=Camelina sativa TaxID=90675 RepID=A0ABM1Q745_CAMSA|nr:PREDICTED: putative F-box protein At1g58090 [Camelina sativa]